MKVPGVTLFALLAVLIGVPLTGQERSVVAASAVGAEDLLASPVGTNWTSYNGDYIGRRYSALREINTANVHQLRAAWVFHPGNSQNLEATPVVVRGVDVRDIGQRCVCPGRADRTPVMALPSAREFRAAG